MTVPLVPPVACRARATGTDAIHARQVEAALRRAGSDGIRLARLLADDAAMVLMCPAYDEDRIACHGCRDIAALRLRTAAALRDRGGVDRGSGRRTQASARAEKAWG